MSISMTNENLQLLLSERHFQIRPLEVRLFHSSREVGQCPWSEGNSKMWIELNIIVSFTEKNKARQR